MRASSLARECLPPIAAGLLHAVLMFCAFPPVGAWPLALLAILPLVWAGVRERDRLMALGVEIGGPRSSIWRRGWRRARLPLLVSLGVCPLWAYEQVWTIDVSAVGYYPFFIVPSLFAGAFVWLLGAAGCRWPRLPLAIAAPVLWTGLEVFRGEVAFSGYSWLLLAHPLIDAPVLPLPAAVLGTYFVGFIVAMIGGAAADVIWATPRRWRAAAVAAAAAALVWGLTPLLAPLGSAGPGPFRIAVVQTNLPQDNKMEWPPAERLKAFERFSALTREAATAIPRPDVIVWPETIFPGLTLDGWLADRMEQRAANGQITDRGTISLFPLRRDLMRLQAEVSVPLIVGAQGYKEGPALGPAIISFNSAYLIQRGQVQPVRYDKLLLTPFGEIMPYISEWPWLQQKLLDVGARGMTFDLTPGDGPRVFEVSSAKGTVVLGTPICFEATKPAVCRALATQDRRMPTALVNLTNDGWFGWFDPGRWQHLQIARWRALELGVPVVRAANTGVSASIDGRGRLLKSGVEGKSQRARVDGVLLADVNPQLVRTVYSHVGRVFDWIALAAAALLWLSCARRRKGPSARVPA